jgi:porin
MKKILQIAIVGLLATGTASAQEGLAGLQRISDDKRPDNGGSDTGDFGAVETNKKSIANLAPLLIAYFNNGSVFGLPGTETGDFWHRTQLTGDWGGLRTRMARRGWFFDMYTTTAYQNLTSGGLQTGESLVSGTQISVNLDTARAGLWSGGLFHFAAHSRNGDNPSKTFTAGGVAPQYIGLANPGPLHSDNIYPTEYFLVQALTPQFGLLLGRISDIYTPDQTLIGDSYKADFANFNLLKNPMTLNFYNPTALSALVTWTPKKSIAIGGGILDPYSDAANFADRAFERVNWYLTGIFTYSIHGLPGQASPAFNWSNKPHLALDAPYGPVTAAQAPEAVAALLDVAPTTGLPANFRTTSGFSIVNATQYLYVKDRPAAVGEKLRSGQPVRGLAVFGRLGYAPDTTNKITRDGSIAVWANGVFDARENDRFGAGFYVNQFSHYLKEDIASLTAGTSGAKNEKGTEIFYDFAVTPALRIIPSYQHLWNPLTAKVAVKQDHADVFLLRLAVNF